MDAKIWIPVLLRMTTSRNMFQHEKLTSHFLIFCKQQEKTSPFAPIVKSVMNLVDHSDSEFDIKDCVSFLNNFSPEDESEDLIKLIVLLFNKSGFIDFENMKFDYMNEHIASRLYHIQHEYSSLLSSNFAIWIGKALSRYYLATGNVPKVEVMETDNSFFNEYHKAVFINNVPMLDCVFLEMIKTLSKADIRTRACFDRIAGAVIAKSLIARADDSSRELSTSKRTSSFSSKPGNPQVIDLLSVENLFAAFKDYLLPMDNYICSLANSDLESNDHTYYQDGLTKLLSIFPSIVQNDTFENWTLRLFFALVTDLSTKTSITTLLSSYVIHVPSFAASSMSSLVMFYINQMPRKKITDLASIINKFFAIELQYLSKESIELFLQIVLLILIASRSETKTGTGSNDEEDIGGRCSFVHDALNQEPIFKAAQFVGKSKTALLLFEYHYTDDPEFDLTKCQNNEDVFLESVYASLEVSDLMFGIPVKPTLDYGLNILQNTGNNWTTMMFDNASFELALSAGEADSHNSKDVVNGMMNSGLTGISKMLDEYSGYQLNESNGEFTDIVYERYWKLNQWDLPSPEKCSGENASIYKTLKSIHDMETDATTVCMDNIESLVSSTSGFFASSNGVVKMEKVESWLRALSSIESINDSEI
ncbi:unnamed protein product [Ambrosiozyma monospora]|uniref:Unnamed protein product n=1 Tax=Ambrosiozyma monospora TaxID=43982 RepID=A0ACB5T597_AMBMO|nr:unnamed protein product [Ambrosiozyma monospora]